MRTSKYSYFLLFAISLPLYICCEEVLSLWLGEVPAHTVSFCRLMILLSLLDALQGPLWVSVQATGKIRDYQILMSVMILSNLPFSYLLLRMGYMPEVVLEIRCMLNFFTLFVRLCYLRRFTWKIILLGMVSLLMDGLAMYYLGLDREERKLVASQLKKIYEKYK